MTIQFRTYVFNQARFLQNEIFKFPTSHITGFNGLDSKYPRGVNDDLIRRAQKAQRFGAYPDENWKIVKEKADERRQQELEKQAKNKLKKKGIL